MQEDEERKEKTEDNKIVMKEKRREFGKEDHGCVKETKANKANKTLGLH